MNKGQIECNHCGYSDLKENFPKSCGNCFACTGCEMYACPDCGGQIVLKAPSPPRRRTQNE